MHTLKIRVDAEGRGFVELDGGRVHVSAVSVRARVNELPVVVLEIPAAIVDLEAEVPELRLVATKGGA